MKKPELIEYGKLLSEIKRRVREGQQRAAISVNATLILTYWEIGQMIALRQVAAGWGAPLILQQAAAKLNSSEIAGTSDAVSGTQNPLQTTASPEGCRSVNNTFFKQQSPDSDSMSRRRKTALVSSPPRLAGDRQ